MIRPAALVLALAATGTLAASLSRTDANTVEGAKKPGGGYNGFPSFPSFPPYGYAAGFQQGNFGFPGSAFPAPFQMPFPPAPHAAFDFNSVFNAYISALQQYTDNLQKLQQQYQQTQAAIASSGSKAGGRGVLSDLREALCRNFQAYLGRDPSVCSNPGPSYFVGSATGASTGGGPGQISVSAPPGSVVQHFEGPGGLQGVSVTTSGNGFQGFAGGASFGGGPFSAGSFGGSSSSSVGGAGGAPFSAGSFGGAPFAAESFGGAGGAPFAAGTFGSGGGNNGGGGGVFTSSSSGVSSVNGQTESFHQSTTGHVDNNGQVSSITVSKP
ncbi:keratin, type I cytoskeletal 9-like isoform X2 [Cloeon dipterum]|uniref:keratin, type I cytoskeletal 9-like isoform X2 n=1 Tax=Cloeon dipterum TaxID=197152 RepID=UPI0032202E3F